MRRRTIVARPQTLEELAKLGAEVRAECADLPPDEYASAVRARLAQHGTSPLETIRAELAVRKARQAAAS